MQRISLFFWFFVFISGCASGPLKDARREFFLGRPYKGIEILEREKQPSKRDRLLFFMEKGLLLHHTGQYKESIDEFLKAANLIEQQEIISVSRQAGSIVTTEWLTEYKGEYSERLWVHTYLIINYLLINHFDDALVEAKLALKIMDEYPKALSDAKFTRALIAICYESVGKKNDAFIEYEILANQLHDPSPVALKLYLLAHELGFKDKVDYYSQFIKEEELLSASSSSMTELILFISKGRIPVKVPSNIVLPPSTRISLPRYNENRPIQPVIVYSKNSQKLLDSITTDLGEVVKESLNERAARIIAKEAARVTAKEMIANEVGEKYDKISERLLRTALFLMEEPDIRSWQTLPRSMTIVSIPISIDKPVMNISVQGRNEEIPNPFYPPKENFFLDRKIFHSLRVDAFVKSQ